MPNWLWFLTVIPALGFLVFVHELGHFLTALRMGIKVEEFGFGYPPRILTLFHWKGVPVTLNWLPLGGFVRMAGEEGNFDIEGSLAAAPPWKKIPVMAAGAFMNIIAAIAIFAIVGMVGQPDEVGPLTIQKVDQGSPAAQAGLQPGDVILTINSKEIDSRRILQQELEPLLGKQVTLGIERQSPQNGSEPYQNLKNVVVTPRVRENLPPNQGPLGITIEVPADKVEMVRYADRLSPLAALLYGVQHTFSIFFQMLFGLGTLIGSLFGLSNTEIQGGLAGPVGIGRLTGEVARTQGLMKYLELTALISVNLALFNLLPIPALDGSRIVFALIEWVRRGKRVPPEKEAMVHAIGMIALLGLMLVVTFSDVRNILLGRNPFGN
jgi:regulator of sigma E protease